MGKGFILKWEPTTSSNAVTESMTSWYQLRYGSVELNHIFLRATQGDHTTFNFKITSPNGNVIFERKGITGELNEKVDFVMRGLYVLAISDCQPDDTFSGEFSFKDLKSK